MESTAHRRRLRFSLRDALMLMMVVAVFLGWRNVRQEYERRLADLNRQLAYAKTADGVGQRRLEVHRRRTNYPSEGLLARANLEDANLADSTLTGQNSAFALTVFNNANLQNASLTGGRSAFRGARFFNANLQGARLNGGVSAFQFASFIGADLAGAVLVGGASAFQGATFQNATLIDARIICSGASFQTVNLDGANFQGADISQLEAESLKSCFFQTPPLYDDDSKFPSGFDPTEQGWKRQAK